MTGHPILKNMEQQADGWVKKYVLTYELPDGTLHEYHSASRRGAKEYAAKLERNARASRAAMAELEKAAELESAAELEKAAAPEGTKGNALAQDEQPSACETIVPDAVCIVARTPRNTLVMEREFRYPLNSWCVALPAGLVDPGEDILACAARELSEETGYEVIPGTPMRALPQAGYSSTGLTDETVQVVFVEAEKAGEAHTESSELIEVFELPVAGIDDFLNANRLPIGTRAQLILELMKALG